MRIPADGAAVRCRLQQLWRVRRTYMFLKRLLWKRLVRAGFLPMWNIRLLGILPQP
jgi:hypothetical protein